MAEREKETQSAYVGSLFFVVRRWRVRHGNGGDDGRGKNSRQRKGKGDRSPLAVFLSPYESPSSDGSRKRWTDEPQRSKVKAGNRSLVKGVRAKPAETVINETVGSSRRRERRKTARLVGSKRRSRLVKAVLAWYHISGT